MSLCILITFAIDASDWITWCLNSTIFIFSKLCIHALNNPIISFNYRSNLLTEDIISAQNYFKFLKSCRKCACLVLHKNNSYTNFVFFFSWNRIHAVHKFVQKLHFSCFKCFFDVFIWRNFELWTDAINYLCKQVHNSHNTIDYTLLNLENQVYLLQELKLATLLFLQD